MSRQRFIYPEIWRSEQFLSLSIEARLLFIGIFSTSDDYGRHKASALSLKAEIFPADACTTEQVTAWRNEIAELGMIRLYLDGDGSEILDVPSWAKFQKPRHVSESRMPEYPGAGDLTTATADPRRTPGEPPSTTGKPPAHDGSGVVWSGVEKGGIQARRRRKAKGVPLHEDFDTTSGITAPADVVPEDWWRLLRLTAEWPVAGKDGGLKKLAAILKANGPKDAEAYIAKANRCWKAGGVKVGPWAIFATGFQPSDGDRDDGGGGSGNRKVSRDAEAIGDVLAKGITG